MLIEPQTGAVTKEVYLCKGSMIHIIGTIGATNIGIEVYDGTSAWLPMTKSSTVQQLNSNNTYWVCEAEGKYRINKPSTVGAAGVRLHG